jgi:predicted nucleic acid-binding protein
MSPERALIDTNVLVYAIYEQAPQHGPSRRLLERCQRGEQPLAVSPQNLLEFYAIVTNHRRVTAPYPPREAIKLLRQILTIAHLDVVPPPPDIHERLLSLLELHPVSGSRCFDLQLVATALAYGIGRVYTYNTADFKSTGLMPTEP